MPFLKGIKVSSDGADAFFDEIKVRAVALLDAHILSLARFLLVVGIAVRKRAGVEKRRVQAQASIIPVAERVHRDALHFGPLQNRGI